MANVPFLNRYEMVTYEKLLAVTDKVDAHTFAKVRLADVIRIERSGISDVEFGFALRSHVDFLVTDSEYRPQFCVEFDGPSHRYQDQMRRDDLKDGLLRIFGVPYIRIDARWLDSRFRGLDLLTYFADVWFLYVAFEDAQTQGLVPYGEPFDPTFIISDGTAHGERWPYWLSLDHQLAIQRLYEAKQIMRMAPSHWIGEDDRGNLQCISWLPVNADAYVVAEGGMRAHLFPAVDAPELLAQVGLVDLYDHLTAALQGRRRLMHARRFSERAGFYRDHYEFRSSILCTAGLDL